MGWQRNFASSRLTKYATGTFHADSLQCAERAAGCPLRPCRTAILVFLVVHASGKAGVLCSDLLLEAPVQMQTHS